MKLAIFDFDGTLFPKDTLPFLLSQWKKLKYSRVKYFKTYISLISLYIKYKSGIESKLSREQMRLIAVGKFNNIFSGMTEQELMQYFTNCSKEIKGLLNESVVCEVKKAKLDGYHTVLLSGSYYYLLKDIGDYLQFDTVIGTEMHFKDNLFDLNKELEIISGALKIEKVYEYFSNKSVDWKASRAYADSYSDIHILKTVGQPVAVNPDAKLESIATQMNWRIIV